MLALLLLVNAALESAPPAMEEVGFRVPVASAEIAATVTLPPPGGPKPAAVVLLPGSACATRSEMRPYARAFARRGIAAVTFDKRGCGQSTGAWTAQSLDDLAADALALGAAARRRPEIDGRDVGLFGVSQGGWVAPLAAARGSWAFLVVVTGGGVPPREVEARGYQRAVDHAGVTESERRAAMDLVSAYLDYLAGRIDRPLLNSRLAGARATRWYGALGLERVLPDEARRAMWSWVAEFDPAASIAALQLPVLVLLGGHDPDADVSVARWTEGLRANPRPQTEVRWIAGVGHALTVGGHHAPGAVDERALDDMAVWAARTLGDRRLSGR